jgi:hypothetical protein
MLDFSWFCHKSRISVDNFVDIRCVPAASPVKQGLALRCLPKRQWRGL